MLSQANSALKLPAAQRLSVRRLLNHSFRPETLMAHTIKVIAAGFGLLGLCLLIGAWLGSPTSAGLATAAKVFIPLWLVGAAINMWLGVTKAGYSVAEEVPFFLLVFAVPAAVAVLLAWRFGRS